MKRLKHYIYMAMMLPMLVLWSALLLLVGPFFTGSNKHWSYWGGLKDMAWAVLAAWTDYFEEWRS